MFFFSQAYSLSINLAKEHAYKPLCNRALVYLKTKKFAEAIKDADAALALNPGWAKSHFRRAEGYLAMDGNHFSLLFYHLTGDWASHNHSHCP